MSRCPICRSEFKRMSMTQKVCRENPACAEQYGREKARKLAEKAKRIEAKRDRLETSEKKDSLKTPKKWADIAQKSVNKYVRLRDQAKGYPCISCNKPLRDDEITHASHYKARGANSALRFHLWNIHRSCVKCNHFDGGNIHGYKPALIDRIGLEKVEFLINHPRSRVYDIDYLKRMRDVFNKKAKRVKP